MKIYPLLQTQPADSLDLQAKFDSLMNKFETTTVSDLFYELADKAVALGLKVIVAIVIYIVGIWLIRKIKKVIKVVLDKRDTDASITSFILSLVSIVTSVVLIIVTVGALGVDTSSLAALLAGGGVAIGLAMNGTMQNFAGGIMIMIFKPFKAGDFIEAQGQSGTVAEVTMVSTELLTSDNKRIIIPNGALFSDTIINYSEMSLRRVEWNIGVEYGASADKTKELITSLLKSDDRVLTTKEGAPADPFVALSSLDESCITFKARVWVKTENYWDVFFSMNEKIYSELPKEGIHFPFPQMDIHLHQDNA